MATNSSSSAPRVDSALEHDFLIGQCASLLAFGVYASGTIPLFRRRGPKRRRTPYILAYTTIVLLVEGVFCVLQAKNMHYLYLNDWTYPKGFSAYVRSTPKHTIDATCLFVLTYLSDLFLLWRCWVIFGGDFEAFVYTLLVSVTTFITSFVWGVVWVTETSHASHRGFLSIGNGTFYYGISVINNIIMTLLIISILSVRRMRLLKNRQKEYAKRNVSWSVIFVESGAMYTLFSVAALVAIVSLEQMMGLVLITVGSFLQPLLSFPIVYRLVDGQELTGKKLDPRHVRIKF